MAKKVKTSQTANGNALTLNDLNRAKQSVNGRLSRLRKTKATRFNFEGVDSPIQNIGVFSDEIDSMEKTLLDMQERLNNATITIEL